jgi:DNA-binding MarR family transcriptional regulator
LYYVSRSEALRTLVRMTRVLERACEDISLAQYRVLAAVADGDERATRLADRLALGKPAISASVDALCRRGLLARADVAHDQRAVALRLTPAGEQVLARTESAMLSDLDAVLAHTPDRQRVVAAVVRLGGGLDRLVAERRSAKAPR